MSTLLFKYILREISKEDMKMKTMKSDISLDTIKPSSFLEMEKLEMQEKVINLGREIVSSLKHSELDPSFRT